MLECQLQATDSRLCVPSRKQAVSTVWQVSAALLQLIGHKCMFVYLVHNVNNCIGALNTSLSSYVCMHTAGTVHRLAL